MKGVRIWSFHGFYFPVLGVNTDIYSVNLQSKSPKKYGHEKTMNLGTFHAVIATDEKFKQYCF